MIDWSKCRDVETKPMVLSGRPVVVGTRVPPDTVIDYVDDGFSPAEIVEQFPSLTVSKVESVIRYAGKSSQRRILLDENLPTDLRKLLSDYDVRSTAHMGWTGLSNGSLIAAAEEGDFDVFLTADKNLGYQQNRSARRIAIVVLSTNRWPAIRVNGERIGQAVTACTIGSFTEVDLAP